MSAILMEWLHILLRWAHVFTGVLWIGTTYHFTWLDHRFHDAAENPGNQVGLAYGMSQVFTGRAAYIHMGALFGTIMAANVWMRIIPAQREMVAAVAAGRAPDAALGARAKSRSKHNTFLVVPLIFLMISNH